MTRQPTPIRGRFAPWALAFLLFASLLAASASAQQLQRLLPVDTTLALGVQDLGAATGLFAGFVDPWVELGVGEALAAALAGFDPAALLGGAVGGPVDPDALDGALDLPPELDGLDLWALLGREAWLGVSVSPFNPLPAVTLLASVDGETAARFEALFARERAAGALALSEGAIPFIVVAPDDDAFPLAAALDGELLALSSNPDVLRGVLRQRQGSPEPGFGDAPAVAATLGALGTGELYGFLDVGPLARALAPLAGGLGFDVSVRRLLSLVETLGPVAGVTRLSPDGTATTSLRRLDALGGDAALVDLLSSPAPAPRDLLGWVPEGAVSVQVSSVDVRAGWAYLGDLVAGLRELGVPDLNRTVSDVLGIDLSRDLFGWTAPGLLVVQTGLGEVAPLGAPADDLLGETVIALPATDMDAAAAGVTRLVTELAQRVALFADPFAAPGANAVVAVREVDVAGVTMRVYAVLPGLTLATAVSDGLAFIATSERGLVRVLTAGRAGGPLPEPFAGLLAQVPADATALTLSDDRAALAATRQALTQQVQLLAGFAPGGIDFDAVDRATDALEAYLDAIAPRFGGSASWSTLDDAGRLRTDERTALDLR